MKLKPAGWLIAGSIICMLILITMAITLICSIPAEVDVITEYKAEIREAKRQNEESNRSLHETLKKIDKMVYVIESADDLVIIKEVE